MLGIRLYFFVSEREAPRWIEAALAELKRKGYHFPNFTTETKPSASFPWILRWDELPPEARPAFAMRRVEWEDFCNHRDDIRIFALYLDAPAGCGVAEFNLLMRQAVIKRYETLKEVAPGFCVRGPWLSLVQGVQSELFYATDSTMRIRRGGGVQTREELDWASGRDLAPVEPTLVGAVERFPGAGSS
jgi:hypothetical protein